MAQSAWLALAGAAAGLVGFRYWGYQYWPFWFRGGEPGRETPADHGVAFEAVTFASGRSRLTGWWAPAPANRASGKAVLICHGNQETLSDWAGTVAPLHGAGHAVLVFDYSGFGRSTGRPSPRQLRRDARAALTELRSRAPEGSELYLIGFSLGTAVLLESLARQDPVVSGMVLAAAYTSVRDLLPELTPLPRWAAGVFPDLQNSLRAIRCNRQPTLILHSRDDDVVPVSHARRLAGAAGNAAVLREVTGPSHMDFFKRPDSPYGDVVLELLA